MKRLIAIQNELKAPKGQYNSFGNYKYRSCEDIIEAVKPLLNKHNLVLNISDNMVNIGDRYYIEACAKLFDEDGKEIMYSVGYAREEESKKGMDWSQITWSSSSYARKYALCGLFAIDDWIDADKTNHGSNSLQGEVASSNRSDVEEKAWFNKEQLDQFVKVANKYKDADEALKCIRSKYKIGKEKEGEVRKLYESLEIINDNNKE